MKLTMIAGASAFGLVLAAGCDKTTEPAVNEPAPPAPSEPAAPAAPAAADAFANAAVYNCAGLGEIQVAYEMGASRKAKVKLPDGKVLDLAMPENATDMMFTDGTNTFSENGGKLTTASIKDALCTPVSRAVPPPQIAGVARDLKAEDAGKTFEFKVGEKFSISLSGVPTAGYVWDVETLPDFLAKAETTGGQTTTAQSQPGFAGGNHWEVTSFEAKKAGSGELVMVQHRPWEPKPAPDDERFKVKVVVK
jgi:inhibitor of cysteine peptidase